MNGAGWENHGWCILREVEAAAKWKKSGHSFQFSRVFKVL